MGRYRDSVLSFLRTALKVFVIFAIVRLAFGVYAIAFLSDDSLAYSLRATAILGIAAIVGIGVALIVRGIRSPTTD